MTGYAFIDTDKQKLNLLEAGIIRPKNRDLFQNKIYKIYTLLDEMLSQYEPKVMVLEKLYAHYQHPITASIIGHVRGVICVLCAKHSIALEEYSVKRIRKAIVGNGSATKIQTQRVVAHMLHIDPQKLTLDASDALALALGYRHIKSVNL